MGFLSIMLLSKTIKTAAAMQKLGAKLASASENAVIIFLYGDLGAGKTTLVRGFLRYLGYKGSVKSPTYTLVENYKLANKIIYHFDLYRLANPEELEYIGIRDYFDSENICLVEWPEKGLGILPLPDLIINIAIIPSGRKVEIIAKTIKGESCLKKAGK